MVDFESWASSVLVTTLDRAYSRVVQLCNEYEKSGFMLKLGKLYVVNKLATQIKNGVSWWFLNRV